MNALWQKVDYSFVGRESSYYARAVELRYRIFFEPEGISLDAVYDSVEEESLHLVAYIEENVVGYGRLTVPGNESQISQIVVEPSYWGKGIGTEIMRILIKRSAEAGTSKIILNARIATVAFYEQFGFKGVGCDFPSKKTGIPHRMMEKSNETVV